MPDIDLLPPFEAYRGNEPYIFVSCARKDGKEIFPEIKYLHDQGYRIWYDEGINPGNEWPEEVATALANASLFLVFISSNATNSSNVRNEINFALNNKKSFIAVHITETQLPMGLQLRMGDIQAVLKYTMDHAAYSRKMLRTLPAYLRESHVDVMGTPCVPVQPKDMTRTIQNLLFVSLKRLIEIVLVSILAAVVLLTVAKLVWPTIAPTEFVSIVSLIAILVALTVDW